MCARGIDGAVGGPSCVFFRAGVRRLAGATAFLLDGAAAASPALVPGVRGTGARLWCGFWPILTLAEDPPLVQHGDTRRYSSTSPRPRCRRWFAGVPPCVHRDTRLALLSVFQAGPNDIYYVEALTSPVRPALSFPICSLSSVCTLDICSLSSAV